MPIPDVHIRTACPQDIPLMGALERQAPSAAHWPESFYHGIFEEGAGVRVSLVAEQEDLLLGFLLARLIGEECELENIVVIDRRQRRGLGWKLIRALIDAARAQRAKRIFLEVRQSNAGARALYEKCDFAITGRRKSYYRDPVEDAVVYTLEL